MFTFTYNSIYDSDHDSVKTTAYDTARVYRLTKQVPPTLILGKELFTKYCSSYFDETEQNAQEFCQNIKFDNDDYEELKENFESLTLNLKKQNSQTRSASLNLFLSSESQMHESQAILHINDFYTFLNAIKTLFFKAIILGEESAIMVQPALKTDAIVDAFIKKGQIDIYTYKGMLDITGKITKDNLIIDDDLNIVTNTKNSQEYKITPHEDKNNYLSKIYLKSASRDQKVNDDLVIEASRILKKVSKGFGSDMRIIFAVYNNELRILLSRQIKPSHSQGNIFYQTTNNNSFEEPTEELTKNSSMEIYHDDEQNTIEQEERLDDEEDQLDLTLEIYKEDDELSLEHTNTEQFQKTQDPEDIFHMPDMSDVLEIGANNYDSKPEHGRTEKVEIKENEQQEYDKMRDRLDFIDITIDDLTNQSQKNNETDPEEKDTSTSEPEQEYDIQLDNALNLEDSDIFNDEEKDSNETEDVGFILDEPVEELNEPKNSKKSQDDLYYQLVQTVKQNYFDSFGSVPKYLENAIMDLDMKHGIKNYEALLRFVKAIENIRAGKEISYDLEDLQEKVKEYLRG